MRLNPDIPRRKLEEIARDLCRDFSATDMTATNYKYYNQIRNGIKISLRHNGKRDFDFVKLVDFDRRRTTPSPPFPRWLDTKDASTGVAGRADFINGLPMVFVELKTASSRVEEAYNDNLKNYLRDIPNLFAFNQICVLSNGLETRLGAFNATHNHFFEWLKVNPEKERPDRQALKEPARWEKARSASFHRLARCGKIVCVDYIENFIMFRNQKNKIIAKPSVFRREQFDGIGEESGGAAGQAGRFLAHPGLRQVLFHGVLCPQVRRKIPAFHIPDHHRSRRS